jgi:hypothetical protein
MISLALWTILAISGQVQEAACWSEKRLESAPIVRAFDSGFVLTLAPSSDPDVEYGCRAELRDTTGRVVFEGEGFNTRLHPESGRDVDGDGHGELIVGIDSGGGNRCCWEYNVISLFPRPRVIAKFDNPGFETDRQGRTVVWTTVAFYDLGPSMAASPTLEIAEQFRNGRLVNVTTEYCDAMLAGELRGQADLSHELASLSEEKRVRSRAAAPKPGDDFDVSETRGAAYTVALQLTYCGRGPNAARLVREVWPEAQQAEVIRTVTSLVQRERSRTDQPRR